MGTGPLLVAGNRLLMANGAGLLLMYDLDEPALPATRPYASSGYLRAAPAPGIVKVGEYQLPGKRPLRLPMALHAGRLIVRTGGSTLCLDVSAK